MLLPTNCSRNSACAVSHTPELSTEITAAMSIAANNGELIDRHGDTHIAVVDGGISILRSDSGDRSFLQVNCDDAVLLSAIVFDSSEFTVTAYQSGDWQDVLLSLHTDDERHDSNLPLNEVFL